MAGFTEAGRVKIQTNPSPPNFMFRRMMEDAVYDDSGLVFIPSSKHDDADVELAFDSKSPLTDGEKHMLVNEWLQNVAIRRNHMTEEQRQLLFEIDPPRTGGTFAGSSSGVGTNGHDL